MCFFEYKISVQIRYIFFIFTHIHRFSIFRLGSRVVLQFIRHLEIKRFKHSRSTRQPFILRLFISNQYKPKVVQKPSQIFKVHQIFAKRIINGLLIYINRISNRRFIIYKFGRVVLFRHRPYFLITSSAHIHFTISHFLIFKLVKNRFSIITSSNKISTHCSIFAYVTKQCCDFFYILKHIMNSKLYRAYIKSALTNTKATQNPFSDNRFIFFANTHHSIHNHSIRVTKQCLAAL